MNEISEEEINAAYRLLNGRYRVARGDVEKALRAAAHTRAEAAGVKVKPLEWDGDRHRAKTIVGNYSISKSIIFDGWLWALDGVLTEVAPSEDEAKAAAQADYERRILSALALPAVPEGVVRAEDWENACHALVWTSDPDLFDLIRNQAYVEADERIAAQKEQRGGDG